MVHQVRRRAVVKGGAWATPTIVAAAAAPRLAASPCGDGPTYKSIRKSFVYTDDMDGEVALTVDAMIAREIASGDVPVCYECLVSTFTFSEASSSSLLDSLGNLHYLQGSSIATWDYAGVFAATRVETQRTFDPGPAYIASNPIVLTTVGAHQPTVPVDTQSGPVTITVRPPTVTIKLFEFEGGETREAEHTQTLHEVVGNNYTLGSFSVVECPIA